MSPKVTSQHSKVIAELEKAIAKAQEILDGLREKSVCTLTLNHNEVRILFQAIENYTVLCRRTSSSVGWSEPSPYPYLLDLSYLAEIKSQLRTAIFCASSA